MSMPALAGASCQRLLFYFLKAVSFELRFKFSLFHSTSRNYFFDFSPIWTRWRMASERVVSFGIDRAIPGHWEGDLLSGGNNTHIATLVERHSRYVLLVRVRGKDTDNVVTALAKQVKRLPAGLMSSLTWDRGTELAAHKRFSVATDVKVYFCDPRSPWQRGSNEPTGYYASTSQKVLIYRFTVRPISTPSR